jgi:citrate lyase subunit beta/citryl-CoA lyase
MVQAVDQLMTAAGASARMTIWAMMGTPLGMLHAEEIACSTARMRCFIMGTSDLAKDMNCAHTRERLPMITSLGLCMLAARGYRLAIIDGVHLDLSDEEGFAYACEQGRDLGFDGKTLIHPKTIAKANEIFAPDAEEVEWSRRIIKAFDEAAVEGKGVVVVDGKLIENLHVEAARQRMALSDAVNSSIK